MNSKECDHEHKPSLMGRMFGSDDSHSKGETMYEGAKGDLCNAGETVTHGLGNAGGKMAEGMGDVFHKIGDYVHPKPPPTVGDKVLDGLQEAVGQN